MVADVIYFILGSIGITFIVTLSYIFKPIRDYATRINKHLGKLLKCPMCMGFWIGIMSYYVYPHFKVLYVAGTISLLAYLLYLSYKRLMNEFD